MKPIKKFCACYLISIGCKQNEYWTDTRYASAQSVSIYKLCPQPRQYYTVPLNRVTVLTTSWSLLLFFCPFSQRKMGIMLMSFNSFSQALGKYNKCFHRCHQWLSHPGILGERGGFRGPSHPLCWHHPLTNQIKSSLKSFGKLAVCVKMPPHWEAGKISKRMLTEHI